MSKKTYLEDFKGTPGKWHVVGESQLHIKSSERNTSLGQAFVQCNYKDHKTVVDHEAIANAMLMAASKELLAVLVECDDYLKGNTQNYIGNGSILHRKMKEAVKLALK